MKGNVYSHRDGWRVYFRKDWFTSDEYGRPFKAKFYALAFLEHLNGLYDPDPRKNRYDPKRFKRQGPYRFDEAFALYLDSKEVGSVSYQRDKKYIWQKHLAPFFCNQDFRTIDGVQLEALRKTLEHKELSGKTIENIFMVLHAFLNHKLFRSAFYAFPEFPELKYQHPKIQWRTEKEIDQVFEFIKEEDKGYFWTIRGYGLRPEEASGLLKTALNFETKEISIRTVFVDGKMKNRTKGGTERVLPMDLCPEAMEYLKQSPSDSLLVFTSRGRTYSAVMREDRWHNAMEQAVTKYNTRPMTLRDLRHSAATMWRLKKVPLDIIRRLLGHSDAETTETFYADIDLHEVVNMVRR